MAFLPCSHSYFTLIFSTKVKVMPKLADVIKMVDENQGTVAETGNDILQ